MRVDAASTMARSAKIVPPALGLGGIKLLEGVPLPALEDLARQCRWHRVSAEQTVISRDATDTDVYMIVSGRVRATAFSAGGRQVNYREMCGGDWFGDFAAIDGLSRTSDVMAVEDTLVAVMSPVVFRRLLQEHAVVCDQVLRRLARSVRELSDRVFEFSTLGVQNRVHAELLRLARDAGIKGNTARIEPAPKHTVIAANISTYREQVTREISVMEKQGLLERSQGALVIPDVERLERIVTEVRRSG